MPILFKSSKEFTLIVTSGNARKSGYPKWVTVWVNADHGRDFHPLADHMTQLNNFTNGGIHAF